MKEIEFDRYVVPLRDRMFRYAQSLLLCADEAEDVTHDLLERLWQDRSRQYRFFRDDGRAQPLLRQPAPAAGR